MNTRTHRTIYNQDRGCLMAVAETAKSSGKASGGARPARQSKSKTPTCRKARCDLSSGDKWLQAHQAWGYTLPCVQIQFNSALMRKSSERYAASQLGSGDEALRYAVLHFADCTRPHLFAASLDPILTQKRLGDGFYEQRLIREQVSALTGNRFLGNYTSDDEEYMALMNNAITVAKAFNLRPGIALTAEQVAQLTSDIVWLVETEVILPDGTKTKALVPQIYVRLQPGDLGKDGLLLAGATKQISANNIQMALAGNLTNTGTIAGRNLVLLNATNINNLGGSISGNNTLVIAKNDINNIGGSIAANNTLALQAGGNINVETTTSISNGTSANTGSTGNGVFGGSLAGGTPNSYSNTIVNRVAGLYAGGNLLASAGGNISLLAAALSAGQNLTLTAVGNILMGTVTTGNQQYINLGGGYINQSASSDVGTTVSAGNNITMQAGGVLVGVAANITGGGNVLLSGDGGVALLAGYNTSSVETNITTGSKGLTSSQTNTLSQSGYQLATGTSVTGSNVQIVSKSGNITLQAANLSATNLLNLSAVNGTINFKAANQSSYASVATTGSSTLTQSASGSGQSTTNASFTTLHYGNLSVAAKAVTVDMSANQSISALATQPGMGWITQLQDDPALAGKIDWNAINEAHKSWNYSQAGLSPAGAALVSLAMAWATGGMGAELLGVSNTIGAAALNAGFTTLATQATIALANNGGNLGAALNSLGSSANVHQLLTSMATAGAVASLPSILPASWVSPNTLGATAQSTFGTQLTQQLINNAATAVVSSAINGTSLSNNLQQGIVNALLTTVAAQGADAIGSATVNGQINTFGQYFAHAALGCVVGAARTSNASGQGGCNAGALGAVVGEAAASTLDPFGTGTVGVGSTTSFAGLMAGMAVALNNGTATQINLGAAAGANAAANNQQSMVPKALAKCATTAWCVGLIGTAGAKLAIDSIAQELKAKYPSLTDSQAETSATAQYLSTQTVNGVINAWNWLTSGGAASSAATNTNANAAGSSSNSTSASANASSSAVAPPALPPDDDEDKQRKGRPSNNTDQNKQVKDAANDENLTKEEARKLGKEVERSSRQDGQNLNYHDIRELARDIKNGRL